MKKQPSLRVVFFNCGFLCVASCLLFSLVGRQWRQGQLNDTLLHAVEADDLHTVRAVLDAGANPDARFTQSLRERFNDWLDDYYFGEPYDAAALVIAAGHGNEAIAQALIEKGADVNVKSRYQAPHPEGQNLTRYSALQLANYHNKDLVRLLRRAGATK